MRTHRVLPLLAAGLLLSRPGLAQIGVERADRPWRTAESQHFIFHFPAELTPWATPIVARFESVHAAVTALVGSTPRKRSIVVMDDPVTVSNGTAIPDLHVPAMFFLATPPGPRSGIGETRGWGEVLSVHEFAHIAHMTRPWRNPLRRLLLGDFLGLGPITRRAPRWVLEGYATYVEGKLTGSGRPHGALRAAVLRQFALEGKLPTYRGLNGSDQFMGGNLAYLAGSAYLEWLVDRRGDSSLVHVWRRLSARRNRSFDGAFAGVFGGLPADLYGRFAAELTGDALEIERSLRAAGLVEGDIVQKLTWQTGDPAVSRDGRRLALVLRSRTSPPRLVVWNTADEPEDAKAARRRARAQARDPEDVPDVSYQPRPKKPVAVLHPFAGRAPVEPRFLPDGQRILVVRLEPTPDGALRPDLFIWNYEAGGLTRVTRGEGIVAADPAPDGRSAVAARCLYGVCDLVSVDLATGEVRTLAAGAPDVVYYRPRFSPDGRRITAAVQREGRWRVVVAEADGSGLRVVGPDDGADRYDAVFLPEGGGLLAVSEAGGIPNLERIDLPRGATAAITRVTGGAMAPDPAPDGWIYYLRLHGKGLDLNRVRADAAPGPVVALDARLAPVAPIPEVRADTFPAVTPVRAEPYGLGPRRFRVNPGVGFGRGGVRGSLQVTSSDPVGRLIWIAQGEVGGEGTWEGASVAAALRRFRPWLGAEAFATRHYPSLLEEATFADPGLDADYRGGILSAEIGREGSAGRYRLRAGVSAGSLDGPARAAASRRLAFGSLAGERRQSVGEIEIAERLELHGAAGSTAGADWTRAIATVGLHVRRKRKGIEAEVARGWVSDGDPFEQFLIGGVEPPLLDPAVLSQRVAMPALAAGELAGRRFTSVYARLAPWSFPLLPFFWAARTEDRPQGWYRVVGLEETLEVSPIPLIRLGGLRTRVGLGYPLDGPSRHDVTLYATAAWRP